MVVGRTGDFFPCYPPPPGTSCSLSKKEPLRWPVTWAAWTSLQSGGCAIIAGHPPIRRARASRCILEAIQHAAAAIVPVPTTSGRAPSLQRVAILSLEIVDQDRRQVLLI